ncbi:MAG: NUDIX domain-containing protein [Verrucomicrobiota bacterium]
MTQARRPLDTFLHCPSCGFIEFQRYGENGKRCRACNYTLFSNPASAAAVFLLNDKNEFLGIRRKREPRKGTWALPGGFVDIGESLEFAAIRETKEEVGLDIGSLGYLASFPNDYIYAGIKYATTDAYFVSRDFSGDISLENREISEASWLNPGALDPDTLAFPSTKQAFETLRREVTAS